MNEDLPEFNLDYFKGAQKAGKRYWVFMPYDDYAVVSPVEEIPLILPLRSHVLDITDDQIRNMAKGAENLAVYYKD